MDNKSPYVLQKIVSEVGTLYNSYQGDREEVSEMILLTYKDTVLPVRVLYFHDPFIQSSQCPSIPLSPFLLVSFCSYDIHI